MRSRILPLVFGLTLLTAAPLSSLTADAAATGRGCQAWGANEAAESHTQTGDIVPVLARNGSGVVSAALHEAIASICD